MEVNKWMIVMMKKAVRDERKRNQIHGMANMEIHERNTLPHELSMINEMVNMIGIVLFVIDQSY